MKRSLLFAAIMAASVSLSAQSVYKVQSANVQEMAQPLLKGIKMNMALDKVESEVKNLNPNLFKKDGENNNAMISRMAAKPIAMYRRPQGYLFFGMTEEYGSSQTAFMFGPAYTPAQWGNLSDNATDYIWSVTDPEDPSAEEPVLLNKFEPTLEYEFVMIPAPELTAKAGTASDSYQYGNQSGMGGVITGGRAQISDQEGNAIMVGAGNYDLSKQTVVNIFGDDQYCFGTGTEDTYPGQLVGIGNYFEKPLSPYVISKVWLQIGYLDADPDAEFTLIIHKMDEEDQIVDTIATSTCLVSDFTSIEARDGYMYSAPFEFLQLDPETGREEPINLIISDRILIELKGFASDKVRTFAPLCQRENNPDKVNYTCIFMKDIKNDETGEVIPYGRFDNLLTDTYSSLLFTMDAVFPFVYCKEDSYHFANESEEKDFDIKSFYSPESWEIEEAPDWVSVDYEFDQENWVCTLKVTAEAYPGTTGGRSGNLVVTSAGATMTIYLTQGPEAISSAEVANVKVLRSGDNFEIAYPAEVSSVTVLNVAGQTIANYELPEAGQFVLPAADLAAGMYILKFNGEKTASVKVVK